MAERKFNLPETKGDFQIRGIVTGMAKQDAYVEGQTQTNKQFRTLKFGIQTDKDNTIFIQQTAYLNDSIYFYNKEKKDTKKVAWGDRNKFREKDYKLIGINIGISKKIDKDGKEVNDNQMLADYDAVEYTFNNLKDGMSVFIRGTYKFTSSIKDEKIMRYTNFAPQQISLTAKPIDFEDENFEKLSDFKQKIVFMQADLSDDKEDKKGIVQAKSINYDSIEDIEFIVRNQDLFKNIKKGLKPYWCIEVTGNITNKVIVDKAEETDDWGDKTSFDKINKTYIREFVIINAKPSTIDKEVYSAEKIDEALRSLREFGDSNNDTTPWDKTTENSEEEDWG